MLIGMYSGTMSAKRRVAVPKRFLEEMGSDLIVAKWYEKCLVLVSTKFWDELFERLTGRGKAKTYGIRDNERFVLGSAFEVFPDDQGRIVVPETLSGYANFSKEVVFLGLRDRVEIWSKESWEQKEAGLEPIAKEEIEKIDKEV